MPAVVVVVSARSSVRIPEFEDEVVCVGQAALDPQEFSAGWLHTNLLSK